MWLLVDLLRVWAPSLITIFGQAASTPAELMGAFALAVVLAGLLPLLVVRLTGVPGHLVLVGCLVAAGTCRVGLQVVGGGPAQLWWSSVGVACAIGWCCLATQFWGDRLVEGYAVGLALAGTSHAALGTWAAVWRSDAWGWTVLAVQIALVVATLVTNRSAEASPATRQVAFVLLPSFLLAGTWAANPARGSATSEAWGPPLVVLGLAAGVLVARWIRHDPGWLRGRLAVLVAGAALTGGTAVVMLPDSARSWTLPLFAVGMPALIVLLGALGRPFSPTAAGPVAGAAFGAVLWVVLFFAYYAGYDLGYRADLLLVLLAAGLTVLGVRVVGREADATARPRRRHGMAPVSTALTVIAGTAAVVAGALGPNVTVQPVAARSDPHEGLRVLAWNLRMGYGMDGTFEPRAVARVIARQQPDVVLLSEIDRAWLLNGGQDQLAILARLLDMEAHFGPAADPVWGDAVLTNLPVTDVDAHPLPSYDAVTGAQALALTVDLDGTAYDVVSTHVQPHGGEGDGSLDQARDIADFVRGRADAGNPVVLGGDFNLEPGSLSWQALLDSGLSDALDGDRPVVTSPADDPEQQIDHVFVTSALTPSDPRAVASELSDHLPVLVTLAPSR
ncbi:hypothetical protein ASG90_08840 [Nocardioides sp. Soil797]|nr:hypothetical protein ASG90_08840 [Nocardioides sp. Soil797]